MLSQIEGLHHVTSLASSAAVNNAFFTDVLGMRRIKKTVNFDAPDVYHLYYADGTGTPGTVMTYFPFPLAAPGIAGAGEVGHTAFSVPPGALCFWRERLREKRVSVIGEATLFGEPLLRFRGPDGDGFSLVESASDNRRPWRGSDVPEEVSIRGFHSASIRVRELGATVELLRFMGYYRAERRGSITRFMLEAGNAAHVLDVELVPSAADARQGAGSVHHIAFAVPDRAAQLAVRQALLDTGYAVTPVIDRNYFWSIYFRSPDGVLFEIATNEPGFDVDEDTAHLGEALKLPPQHEHLRARLERSLQPIDP